MNPGQTDSTSRETAEPPRLLASLRQLALTSLSMAQTRFALASVELEETLQWLIGLLLNAVGLLVFGLTALLTLTLLAVLAADPAQRLTVLAVLAAVYLAVGIGFCWRIRRAIATSKPFLQATLAEMAQDLAALQAASAKGDEVPRA